MSVRALEVKQLVFRRQCIATTARTTTTWWRYDHDIFRFDPHSFTIILFALGYDNGAITGQRLDFT